MGGASLSQGCLTSRVTWGQPHALAVDFFLLITALRRVGQVKCGQGVSPQGPCPSPVPGLPLGLSVLMSIESLLSDATFTKPIPTGHLGGCPFLASVNSLSVLSFCQLTSPFRVYFRHDFFYFF